MLSVTHLFRVALGHPSLEPSKGLYSRHPLFSKAFSLTRFIVGFLIVDQKIWSNGKSLFIKLLDQVWAWGLSACEYPFKMGNVLLGGSTAGWSNKNLVGEKNRY